MGPQGPTFHQNNISGRALAPTVLGAGASAVNGDRIIAPGKLGRMLSFILLASTLTTVTALTINVQYSTDGGSTYTNLLDAAGNAVVFKAANTISGGQLDPAFVGTWAGSLVASVPIGRTNAGDYRLAVTAPTGGVSEAQTITITGSPTGGTFVVGFGGQKTTAIAYNATGATLQTAFRLLSTVAATTTVTGGAGGPYTITFLGTNSGPQDFVSVDSSLLTGGTPVVVVARTVAGLGVNISAAYVISSLFRTPATDAGGVKTTDDTLALILPAGTTL